MHRKTLVALAGALVIVLASWSAALAAGTAAGTGPAVSVQVKSSTKTLLGPSTVHGEKGWITKGGTPHGKCPGNTAAGALDAATHGKWTGKYYASVPGIFISSILGVKPTGSHFWGVFVNGKSATTGICDIKLRAKERLLFKIVK